MDEEDNCDDKVCEPNPDDFQDLNDLGILCDVIPMDVGHVILGRPWLYDLDVTIFG